MKKLLIASLSLSLLLTACQKPEEKPADTTQSTTQNSTNSQATDAHAEHQASEQPNAQTSEATDTHAGHDHAGHDHAHNHAHDQGDHYECEGGKMVDIVIRDNEGETEVGAIIDNIEYDLHPDSDKANQYISKNEGINDKGMILTLNGDKAVFTSLDNKPLLNCQKHAH